ncbi:unnamed protein product [Rhizophagus irregularis]|nr:unnamed protein product [Rhizophagus irregularis]
MIRHYFLSCSRELIFFCCSGRGQKPGRQKQNNQNIVELFKLCLGNLRKHLRPKLPVDYKKAITDYLKEIGKVIKVTIATHWNINFFENVLLVLTVPAEFSEKDIAIMRECAYNANLINDKYSKNLQFILALEAAAIYCMENELQEYDLLNIGGFYDMVVDCGGGTVDLTARKLVGNNPLRLSEVTERPNVLEISVDLHLENNYDQFQFLVQEFCKNVKEPFTGDIREFNYYELDIENIAPNLLHYVDEDVREKMGETDWLIKIDYNVIKQMIKWEFHHIVKFIKISDQLIATISRVAVVYCLSIKSNDCIIPSRVLKYIYGIGLCVDWKEGDPIERKLFGGRICDRSSKYDTTYCDEPGVELLGTLQIDLQDVHLGYNRSVITFGLSFGQMEISAFAKNEVNGQTYVTSFCLDNDIDDI